MKKIPKIMGILNVTDNSFSDGGKYLEIGKAIEHGFKLIEDGADIIDIGGESTRPGSETVGTDVELKRTIPVIEEISKYCKIQISIDTTKPIVAESALQAGATIINDVSGLRNSPDMAVIAAKYSSSLIIMHSIENPKTMQNNPYYHNVVMEVYSFLNQQIAFAKSLGVMNIIADVGICFGKTLEHNIELISNISRFNDLNVPILLGISRKSFLGKILEIENPEDRDLPSVLLHSLLLNCGIDIVRVHNVRYMKILELLINKFSTN